MRGRGPALGGCDSSRDPGLSLQPPGQLRSQRLLLKWGSEGHRKWDHKSGVLSPSAPGELVFGGHCVSFLVSKARSQGVGRANCPTVCRLRRPTALKEPEVQVGWAWLTS